MVAIKGTFFVSSFFLWMLFAFLCGCSEPVDVRNSELNYGQSNNTLATQRLSKIFYNLENKVSPVERFKMVHISDPHLSNWSTCNKYTDPKNLIEAVYFTNQPQLKFNAFVATGDFIGNSPQTEYKEAMAYLLAFSNTFFDKNSIPSFICTGNHDSNIMTKDTRNIITKTDIYQVITSKQNWPFYTEGMQNYFYADLNNPMGGTIRIVSLDVIDQEGSAYDTQHYAVFSQQQIDWLCNAALKIDMTPNTSVVILIHYPFKPYADGIYNYTFTNNFFYPREMIPEIIEAFRSKTRLQKTYVSQSKKTDYLSVNANFTETPGEFVCYLSGHIHTTAILEVDGISNRNQALPRQRMILCSHMSPSDNRTKFSAIERKDDSLSSNSFNIYAIDTKEKKVYVTFFGAYKPSDQPDYKDIQSFNYL